MLSKARGRRRPRASLGAVTALAILVAGSLAACGGGSSGAGSSGPGSSTAAPATVSQSEIDKAMSTPTTLTFWTWVPGMEKEVALFQKKYPAITVKVVNAGQGTPEYTKLRTALKAGTGAPDVVQMEFQYIPTFTLTGALVDLRPYGASALKDSFVDWTWQQVSGPNGEVFAIPQDTGPMGMLYRKDLFDRYGIAVPTTWDEFAEAARKLHAAAPDVLITDLASNESGVWSGLMWQAHAKPFASDGRGKITVNVTDDASRKVAEYWGGLAKEGVIGTESDFTDSWYSALNRGKYATWLTAAWGPLFLSGSAKDTAGKWRAAPLPQWDRNAAASGNWGGSTSAVVKGTKNPIAAATFAQFINSDPESARLLATEQFLFPATKALLSDPAFVGQKSDFYGGQEVNQVFADVSSTVDTAFLWPPFLDQVVSDWNSTVGKSLADRTDSVAALSAWQDRITSYARTQGFTVSP